MAPMRIISTHFAISQALPPAAARRHAGHQPQIAKQPNIHITYIGGGDWDRSTYYTSCVGFIIVKKHGAASFAHHYHGFFARASNNVDDFCVGKWRQRTRCTSAKLKGIWIWWIPICAEIKPTSV